MATLQLEVHGARGLPVMDSLSGQADPYVVVKFQSYPLVTTRICRSTRSPQWNEVVTFETADAHLFQEYPLEICAYDHDLIHRDEVIGLLLLDLNGFVILSHDRPEINRAWWPLWDSMHGFRGEIQLSIKLFPTPPQGNVLFPSCLERKATSLNLSNNTPLWTTLPSAGTPSLAFKGHGKHERRASSLIDSTVQLPPSEYERKQRVPEGKEGVYLFSLSRLDPSCFRIENIYPLVEELLVAADPEQSRLSSLRYSTRSMNDARQRALFHLSGQVQRKIIQKTLKLHCNAVLGYREVYDMESKGILVRAFGTPCFLSVVEGSPQHAASCAQIGKPSFSPTKELEPRIEALLSGSPSNVAGGHPESGALLPPIETPSWVAPFGGPHGGEGEPLSRLGCTPDTRLDSDSSVARCSAPPRVETPGASAVPFSPTQDSHISVVLLSLTSVPCGAVSHIAGTVAARSVKQLSRLPSTKAVRQERDTWWVELREELRANARAYRCNVVLGYSEETTFDTEVMILSVWGTAVEMKLTWNGFSEGPEQLYLRHRRRVQRNKHCELVHMRFDKDGRNGSNVPNDVRPSYCNVCFSHPVPKLLVMSTDPFPEIELKELEDGGGDKERRGTSDGELVTKLQSIELFCSRPKERPAEELAAGLSQNLFLMEVHIYNQLCVLLQKRSLNVVFGFRIRWLLTEQDIIAKLTGTAGQATALTGGKEAAPLPPRSPTLSVYNGLHKELAAQDSIVTQPYEEQPEPMEVASKGGFRSMAKEHKILLSAAKRNGLDGSSGAPLRLLLAPFEPYCPHRGEVTQLAVVHQRFSVSEMANCLESCCQALYYAAAATQRRSQDEKKQGATLKEPVVPISGVEPSFDLEQSSGDMHVTLRGLFVDPRNAHQIRAEEDRVHGTLLTLYLSTCERMKNPEGTPMDPADCALPPSQESTLPFSLSEPCTPRDREIFISALAPFTTPPLEISRGSSGGMELVLRFGDTRRASTQRENEALEGVGSSESIVEFFNEKLAASSVTTQPTLSLNYSATQLPASPPPSPPLTQKRQKHLSRQKQPQKAKKSGFFQKLRLVWGDRREQESEERNAAVAPGFSTTLLSVTPPLEPRTFREEGEETGLRGYRTFWNIEAEPLEPKAYPLFSSCDFVPGFRVERYIGRVSHHLIRMAPEVKKEQRVGVFLGEVERQLQVMAVAAIEALNANALLGTTVLFHEVDDSDEYEQALVFASIFGHAVYVKPIVAVTEGIDGVVEATTFRA